MKCRNNKKKEKKKIRQKKERKKKEREVEIANKYHRPKQGLCFHFFFFQEDRWLKMLRWK